MPLKNKTFSREFLKVSENSEDLNPKFFGGARNVLRAPLHGWKNDWLGNICSPPQTPNSLVEGVFGM